MFHFVVGLLMKKSKVKKRNNFERFLRFLIDFKSKEAIITQTTL